MRKLPVLSKLHTHTHTQRERERERHDLSFFLSFFLCVFETEITRCVTFDDDDLLLVRLFVSRMTEIVFSRSWFVFFCILWYLYRIVSIVTRLSHITIPAPALIPNAEVKHRRAQSVRSMETSSEACVPSFFFFQACRVFFF